MKTRMLCCAAVFFISLQLRAQTYEWWAANVGWDGVSRWPHYMILSPGYQGPNSLPVPEISNGSIDTINAIGATGMFHFSNKDKTQNLRMIGNYCVVKDRLSFDFSWVPVEWYSMTHELKAERHVFSHYYYDNSAQGDFIVNTNVQLLNKWRDHIHLALRLGYRFPVSSGRGAARFTDSPGYYFDLSAGKPFSKQSHWKLNAMIGFYAWQTNRDDFNQDDCFLFGAGLEYNKNGWRWQLNSCGYLGYLDNKDKPVVVRSYLEKKFKHVAALFRLQQGVHDFKYSTLEVGAKYLISPK